MSMSIVKLLVYKTVKCEVIKVEFLSGDLPLKGMCMIDSRLKKIDRFEIFNS